MTKRVYNFGAGPAMLPTSVMETIQTDLLDFKGLGASVLEVSHRSKEFVALIEETNALFHDLAQLPDNYKTIYMHGGAQVQFSAIAMNLIARKPARKALYVETGNFAKQAHKEAARYGEIDVIASGADVSFQKIPELPALDSDASYIHITGNNTIVGTRWNPYPDTGDIPLVVDATSDILSRVIDFSKVGVMYASLQKNLGPSGVAAVIIREDLLEHALPETPKLLNYELTVKNDSMINTTNTFAVYVLNLVLKWLVAQGGVEAIEKRNEEKAALLYKGVDSSDFYQNNIPVEYRSVMNVPFTLPSDSHLQHFLKEALEQGLYALKGHRSVGGVRASIYNAMPLEGVQTLLSFMEDFEKRNG